MTARRSDDRTRQLLRDFLAEHYRRDPEARVQHSVLERAFRQAAAGADLPLGAFSLAMHDLCGELGLEKRRLRPGTFYYGLQAKAVEAPPPSPVGTPSPDPAAHPPPAPPAPSPATDAVAAASPLTPSLCGLVLLEPRRTPATPPARGSRPAVVRLSLAPR